MCLLACKLGTLRKNILWCKSPKAVDTGAKLCWVVKPRARRLGYFCWTVEKYCTHTWHPDCADLTGVDGAISDCDVLRRLSRSDSDPDCSAWQCRQCNVDTLKCQICDLHRRLCSIRYTQIFRSHPNYWSDMLNCKINSTNGGTFSKCAGKFFWVFFLVQRA